MLSQVQGAYVMLRSAKIGAICSFESVFSNVSIRKTRRETSTLNRSLCRFAILGHLFSPYEYLTLKNDAGRIFETRTRYKQRSRMVLLSSPKVFWTPQSCEPVCHRSSWTRIARTTQAHSGKEIGKLDSCVIWCDIQWKTRNDGLRRWGKSTKSLENQSSLGRLIRIFST